jgi:hypothetical protein
MPAYAGLFPPGKLKAWQQSILTDVSNKTDAAARAALRRQAAIEKARVLAEQTARSGGIEPLLRQLVDGKEDKTLATVRANSIIVLDWTYTPEVARRTYAALIDRSPKESGDYVRGLLIFVDEEPAGFDAITLNTREVRFVASVDYARRLEVGHDASGQPWVKQVAPHIVEETAIVANRKFGNLARITYNYVDLVPAYQLKNPANWRRRHARLDTEVHYPAIFIVPK